MRIKLLLAVLISATLGANSWAQSCNNPIPICGEIPEAVSLSFVQSLDFDCINTPYVTVLEFMSNSDVLNTGNVRLDVTGVTCQIDDIEDIVECVIVKPDPQALCETSAYIAVSSPCVELAGSFTIESEPLEPNTTYLILLGTGHDPSVTPCNMTLLLSGPAVSINACCSASIAPGQSVPLTVIGGDIDLGYTWFPGYSLSSETGDEVTASPGVTTTYSVSGFFGGCQYTDALTITVGNPLDIPTGFTPNGDEVNELWTISGLANYEFSEVMVYDRWGQLVHRSIGYVQAWDGTRNGKDVPEGTYYYAIDLNDPNLVDLETITGYISIIR